MDGPLVNYMKMFGPTLSKVNSDGPVSMHDGKTFIKGLILEKGHSFFEDSFRIDEWRKCSYKERGKWIIKDVSLFG